MKPWLRIMLATTLGSALPTQASTLSASSSATVIYSGSQLVQGSQAGVTAFNLPSAGELFVTLTDLKFPDPFSSLSFDLSDTTSTKTALSAPGVLTLNLAGPATLYANVFAKAGGSTNLGLYNLTASFLGTPSGAPVPLPATGGLLAAVTALAALFELFGRRRARTIVTTSMA